jgi:hypothetical protein
LHAPDSALTSRLSVLGSMEDRFGEILTEEALDFVAGLHSQFAGRRADLFSDPAPSRHPPRPQRPGAALCAKFAQRPLAPLRQDQQGLGSLHGRMETEVLPCSVLLADEGFFRC